VTGRYSLALPEGRYVVDVACNGYRRLRMTGIDVVVGQFTQADADLARAPTLLLVDSGAWYYGSQIGYLRQALDDGAYVYDTWTIRQVPADTLALEDLAPYDVTVWSSPLDAPGLIGAGEVISSYLTAGGNLFLTGQDEYVNPYTKEVERDTDEYKYRWTNFSGDKIYSNERDFDPNRIREISNVEWKLTPVRER
jgi:hypothetical protein